MDITEEQRQRTERNRLAALAKRKASTSAKDNNNNNTWALFKCRKVSRGPEKPITNPFPQPQHPFPFKFRIRLEICSPDSFSITPAPLPSFPYPGEKECFNYLSSWLSSVMPSRYTQNHSGRKASVYKLIDYHIVLQCLKKLKGNEIQEIPWRTLAVVQKLSHSFVADRWMPCMPEHLSDDDVDALLKILPKVLLDALLPFQLDGVRYALRRGGRCLIADEMGLGKTIQAIAIACCFMNEGPILVVCPAILRYSWAEELERWLPICSPSDIHLVFGHQDNPIHLRRCPKVVVISYTMLQHLQKSISEQQWALLVFDESHHVRCSKKRTESDEVKAVLEVAAKVKRKILLSGTPSLSRPYDIFHQINMLWPGLLGTEKYEFAKTYCETKFLQGSQGKIFQDFSKGIRLEELNVLLTQTIMIRRLKEHVLVQLPPKRRQIIRLVLTRSDIVAAIMASDTSGTESRLETPSVMKPCTSEINDGNDGSLDALNDCDDNSTCHRSSRELSYQELGIAKLSGFREWFSLHPIVAESECEGDVDMDLVCQKMVIFAHHIKVLDGIQAFICEKGIGFVCIDGNTLARDRQSAVQAFRSSAEIKIAIIGITAGGVGIDFSSAQNVVFLELPQSVSEMLQAEDRAHRRGQTNAVNIYIFCAKDTSDERRWPNLNKSLHRVSSVMNGKYDAVREIAIDRVSDLALEGQHSGDGNSEVSGTENTGTGHSGASPISKIDCGISSSVLHEPYEAETSNSENGSVVLGLQPVKNNEEIPLENLVKEKDSNACDIIMTENSVLNGKGYTSEASKIACPKKIDGNKLDVDDNEMLRILLPQAKSLKSESDEELSVGDESGPIEVIRDDACLIPSDSLRFEVSKYTGRVHLYTCIPGKDLRPKPLFENFHPEELDLLNISANKSKKTGEYVVKENPAYLHNLLGFVKEWNNLRPIEKSKLLGKPLQLPLSFELYYLKESMNHGSKGLLNGGSKRRSTPLNEISYSLPENAEWKVVSLCSGYGKKEKQYTQGWTVTGEPLCKLCQTPCKGKLAKKPEFFEDLFCNMICFKEYRTRTSQRCLREELFKIEHGVCRLCNLDCHKLIQGIRPLSVLNRQKYIERVAPKLASQKKLVNKLVNEPVEGNAWHADHIIAVHKGGGECSLDNMRTLCVACHKEVTAAQRTDQRLARKEAKDQLKAILRTLRNVGKAEKASSKLKNQSKSEMETNQTDEELLFTVPGSAYTIGKSMVIESEQSCSNEDLLFKVAGSSYSEGKNTPFQEEKESSSNGDGLLFTLPCSVHTEGTSTVVECEQKSSSKDNELLCKVPSSAITECKSTDIETKENSFSNQDYFSTFNEGKSTTIEIKEKVFPNEDDLHLEVPSTVGSEVKSTVIHSE